MRVLMLSSVLAALPHFAHADPQCLVPPAGSTANPPAAAVAAEPASTGPSPVARLPVFPVEPGGISAGVGTTASPAPVPAPVPALDRVLAAGATLMEAGTSHGLRAVVARNEGQFMRMYLSPDGQALVTGFMLDMSVAELKAMADGRVTDLGEKHGLRGFFVPNGNQYQVFYASPDGRRIIPGAMFDAAGKNVTREQVAPIPGTIPTVVIGDVPGDAAAGRQGAAPAQAAAGSLLKAVESTAYGTAGPSSAPRLWMFVDPLCSWSVRAMEQLRPLVAAGRIQVAVVPLSLLDHEDRGRSTPAAKALLSVAPDAMVATWREGKFGGPADPQADARLAQNITAANAIGLRGTPTFVWRKTDGTEGRADGLPKDLAALVASIGG